MEKIRDDYEDINKTVKNMLDSFIAKDSNGEEYLEQVWQDKDCLNFIPNVFADFLFHHLSKSDWKVEKPFWKEVIKLANEPKIKVVRNNDKYNVAVDSNRCFQDIILSVNKRFVLSFYAVLFQNPEKAIVYEKEKNHMETSISSFNKSLSSALMNVAENNIEVDVKNSPFPAIFYFSSSSMHGLNMTFTDLNLGNAALDYDEKIVKTDLSYEEYLNSIKPALEVDEFEKIIKTANSFVSNHFIKTYDSLAARLIFVTFSDIENIAKSANRSSDDSILELYLSSKRLNKTLNDSVENIENVKPIGSDFKI